MFIYKERNIKRGAAEQFTQWDKAVPMFFDLLHCLAKPADGFDDSSVRSPDKNHDSIDANKYEVPQW